MTVMSAACVKTEHHACQASGADRPMGSAGELRTDGHGNAVARTFAHVAAFVIFTALKRA